MEASRVEKRGGYLDLSRLSPGELLGMVAAGSLVVSLFLPWFTTSATNPNSTLAGASGGESVTAFDTFTMLQWLLVAAAAPLIVEIGLVVAGYLRQALYTDVRKPPGVL